jgi:hypothetical protein
MNFKFLSLCSQWLLGLLVMMLLLTGCVAVAQPSGGAQSNGITIQGDPLKLSFNTPELMCKAILVLDAGISGRGASHWNTPTGSRPAAADQQTLLRNGYAIYTPIQFSNMHIHMDHRSQPTREFATVGGQVGPDQYWIGYPQVTPQDSYLLVLVYGIDAQSQAESKALLVVTDAFPIDAQGIVTLQAAHDEGKGADTQHFPAVTMPLSQITQQLAACK